MAPSISSATRALSYGLYACEFDPQDAGRLIVGGGGGASRTGVGNKIVYLPIPPLPLSLYIRFVVVFGSQLTY